jgi:hypothetical protein
MRIFHSSGGYLVWIFETAHCDSFTLKLLIPQTDAETQALLAKVKQRMHGGCCYAVGRLVINRGAGGSGT